MRRTHPPPTRVGCVCVRFGIGLDVLFCRRANVSLAIPRILRLALGNHPSRSHQFRMFVVRFV